MKNGIIQHKFNHTGEYITNIDDELSVLTAGYIITIEGEIIKIEDYQNHQEIFSKFYQLYLNISSYTLYELFTIIELLTSKLGHIIYIGTKTDRAYISANSHCGNVILPNTNTITALQHEALNHILKTNISIFKDYNGNTKDIVNINFFNCNDEMILPKDIIINEGIKRY